MYAKVGERWIEWLIQDGPFAGHPVAHEAYDLALPKQVIYACLGGLTYDEIAEHFGLSVNAMRTYLRLHCEGDLSPPPSRGWASSESQRIGKPFVTSERLT